MMLQPRLQSGLSQSQQQQQQQQNVSTSRKHIISRMNKGMHPAAAQRTSPCAMQACSLRVTGAFPAAASAGCLHERPPSDKVALSTAGLCSGPSRRHRPVTALAAAATAVVSAVAATPALAVAASGAPVAAGLNSVIAVLIGYLVLAGSCFRSVPQILVMVKAKSAEGLSLTANIAELFSYTVNIAYNVNHAYPFNTYGDSVPLWLQDIVIVGLILKHLKVSAVVAAAASLAFAGACWWLFSGNVSMEVLGVLQSSNILVGIFGMKLPQIILNMKRGNSGVLSVATCLLNVAGNTARIYTTIVLTQDKLLLLGVGFQLCLNAVLLAQALATSKARAQAPEPGLA